MNAFKFIIILLTLTSLTIASAPLSTVTNAIKGLCQGDCNNDNDCEADLICFQRSGDVAGPPGCTGTPATDIDYCIQPELSHVGVTASNLGLCEGDCDIDKDCIDDLVCYQRSGNADYPPGCSNLPTTDWDYCINPILTNQNVAGTNLGLCQGDCDRDSDCKPNLVCHQRDNFEAGPPGCSGVPKEDWDYCIKPILTDVDVSGTNLGLCQGHCDEDADCFGDLVCYERSGIDDIPPGCNGNGQKDWDYCIYPQLDDIAATASNLGLCGGDCDITDDCKDDLICYQRTGIKDFVPGCSGNGVEDWDYCTYPLLTDVNVAGVNLGLCQGDCDDDNDCEADLVCFQRSTNGYDPPGCSGNAKDEWDYCIKPILTDVDVAATNLGLCQGDCDYDADCLGDLVCYQRTGIDSIPPGCSGKVKLDWDYCINPQFNDVDAAGSNLGLCEGDCDTDRDCNRNLVCYQRVGFEAGPPGCSGVPQVDWDYCIKPILTDVDVSGTNLGVCEGDCDEDTDCFGDLVCYERSGIDDIPPGCNGNAQNDWDYCIYPQLNDIGTSGVCGNFGLCEGNCGNDMDCDGNLICYERSGDAPGPPGCSGDATTNTNYCINQMLGDVHESATNLRLCQGDCDTDEDCEGDLKCFQRESGGAGPPGCSGKPFEAWDYCYQDASSVLQTPQAQQMQPQIELPETNAWYNSASLSSSWIKYLISGLIILGVVLTFNVVLTCYMNFGKRRAKVSFKGVGKYDYEADAINVQSDQEN